jgi:DNA-directed RNA polymerase subunit RPC12/RpoP
MKNDWWSKKLAGEKPTPRTYTPPTTTSVQIGSQQHTPQPQGNQRVLDENASPTSQIPMGAAIRMWKGGEAHRKEGNMTCPECGSRNVFSRRGSGTTINGHAPAPRCYECGWNGKYSQGNQVNWVS